MGFCSGRFWFSVLPVSLFNVGRAIYPGSPVLWEISEELLIFFFLEHSAFLFIRMKGGGASKFLKFWPRKHVSYHLLFFTELILFLFKRYLPTWSPEKCVSLCAFLVIIIHFLILFWKESCYIEERDLRKRSTLGGRMVVPARADSWEPTVKSLFCSVFSDILLVAWDQPQG